MSPVIRHAGIVFPSTSSDMKDFTQETETQDWAYGPQHCRQLAAGLAKSSDGMKLSGSKTLSNADSYAWFANVSTPSKNFQIYAAMKLLVQIDCLSTLLTIRSGSRKFTGRLRVTDHLEIRQITAIPLPG